VDRTGYEKECCLGEENFFLFLSISEHNAVCKFVTLAPHLQTVGSPKRNVMLLVLAMPMHVESFARTADLLLYASLFE